MSFGTEIIRDGESLVGPWRAPAQMLAEQDLGGHTSVHDDDTAARLGLAGAPIEGPTHFSQIDPLAVERWGQAWFEHGCLSSHFLNMVVEGEQVRATLTPETATSGRAVATKRDGTPVLTATVSLGSSDATELDERRRRGLDDPGQLFIVDQLEIGLTRSSPEPVTMEFDEHNGALYPFTLAQKLARITEPCSWYDADGDSPWGRPIVPTEMISVLAHKAGVRLPVRGPAVGLFIDLEVRYVTGPVLVGQPVPGRAHGGRHRPEQAGRVVLDRIHTHGRRHRCPHGDGAAAPGCLQGLLRRLPDRLRVHAGRSSG